MKRNALYLIIVLIVALVIAIGLNTNSEVEQESMTNDSLTESPTMAEYPYPVGVLFENKDYSYFIEHVTEPGQTDAFMVAGYNNSSTIDILEDGTALVSFAAHPKDWNGGGTLAQRPVQLDPYNVHYDLSGVKTISFEIKSSDFEANQISFGIQWEGPDYDMNTPSKRKGGEKLFTLEQLGVSNIKKWTKVSIDISQGGDISDTGTPRHEHTALSFHAASGKTFVKVPLMMIWEGRTHKPGESFKIRNIAFHNAAEEHVEIASDILAKAKIH